MLVKPASYFSGHRIMVVPKLKMVSVHVYLRSGYIGFSQRWSLDRYMTNALGQYDMPPAETIELQRLETRPLTGQFLELGQGPLWRGATCQFGYFLSTHASSSSCGQ